MKKAIMCFVALLAIAAATGPARAQNSSTSSLVFEAACNGSGTANDNVVWTVTSDGSESTFDNTKGIHYGTSKATVGYIELSTSSISGTITQVVVNAAKASGVNATVGVTVGGNAFGGDAQSLTTSAEDYTFTGSASGAIVVRVAKPSAAYKALYVKSIEVTYTPASSGGGSTPEPPTPGQNENLLTTITPTSLTTYDETTPGVVNVILDGQLEYNNTDGWMAEYGDGNQGSVTVTAKPGFSIDSCKFYVDEDSYTVTAAPFAVYPYCSGSTQQVYPQANAQGSDLGYGGVKRIEVYGTALPPQPHTVRFADGNDGWTVTDVDSARSATAPAVLQNVIAGDSLVVTAPAMLPGKVKSVKAVKYVAPAATVTTAPTATGAYIEVGSTAALVNAGAANGGTMMYAVTTTNAQPASTADFSASIPTAQGRAAGTYYVWYYAKADADHSDSEIAGPVSVPLVVITTVTWNSTNVFNSAHHDDMILNNEWNSNPLTYEGVTISMSGEEVSSFHAYNEHDQAGSLTCFGDNGDSFTFTAPSGKKFCKIEIIDDWGATFTNYGDWRQINNNIVWSGTAANTVTLGTVFTSANYLNSIVFKLIDD